MKKYIVLIVLAFAASFCFSYSKPKKTSSKEVVKTGGIKVYGNEPFTFIGFSCDDGELYTLIGSDKLISELSNNQGYHLEIKGYVEKPNETDRQMNKLKNGYLVVEKWKKIDE